MCAQSGSPEHQDSGFGEVGVRLPDDGASQVTVPFCGAPEMGMYNSRGELVQLKSSLHQRKISI
uniref:GH03275p n=1 Tax=Drosophila melanogaster TaxID=7227 RepID=Q8MRR3_DROME|nr:GH03275p [Drosophila melanogaster]